MRKIASPQDVQAELRRLLAYSQEAQPSRFVLAAELQALALRVAAKAAPTTAEDLTKPLTTGAILVFDPYPWLDNGNLKLEKGEVPLDELEAYLAREDKKPVKLTPTTKRDGNSLIVDAKHGDETDPVVVSLQRLKK